MIALKRVYHGGKEALNSATRFSVGNGHIGYRGTLEEEQKTGLPCFSMVGFYDQYQDKWREPVSYPNPFAFSLSYQGKRVTWTKTVQTLDLENGIYYRESTSQNGMLRTERFASRVKEKLIAEKITFQAKKEGTYTFLLGMTEKVIDINGPHFKEMKFQNENGLISFHGITNEEKEAEEFLKIVPLGTQYNDRQNIYCISLNKGESISFTLLCYVYSSFFGEKPSEKETQDAFSFSYEQLKEEHRDEFSRRFSLARIEIEGDSQMQSALDYCNYLLVSHASTYCTSISARGFSGQTYKGAAFWDSEIFLLPYYLFYDREEARNLILYRIKGLRGAKEKAIRFHSEGAFYAWESQENGREACTMYSVTDPKTGKGIRTYFIDKQIHISSDIAIAFDQYMKRYPEKHLLLDGGLEMLYEISLFYTSYAKLDEDGRYHLRDVIGPDEYHERVDDNAFTNYQAKMAAEIFFSYLSVLTKKEVEQLPFYSDMRKNIGRIQDFRENLYLPVPDKDGIIEQFDGYLNLEDCSVEEVKKRLTSKNQYWGGKEGPASKTRVIKQADVVSLLALHPEFFPMPVQRKNYDFYKAYTEHGSSLSASMHALTAFRLGKTEEAYRFMKKSSLTDISGKNKEYAGGIYIGGLHMAAAGGSYLSFLYGMMGYDGVNYHPHLRKGIRKVKWNEVREDGVYTLTVKDGKLTEKRRKTK